MVDRRGPGAEPEAGDRRIPCDYAGAVRGGAEGMAGVGAEARSINDTQLL